MLAPAATAWACSAAAKEEEKVPEKARRGTRSCSSSRRSGESG